MLSRTLKKFVLPFKRFEPTARALFNGASCSHLPSTPAESRGLSYPNMLQSSSLHTTSSVNMDFRNFRLERQSKVPAAMTDEYNNRHNDFLDFNKVVYPPFKEGDLIRPAEICHVRTRIRYTMKRFWYICLMVRGMSVDQAKKTLKFHNKRGAMIVHEVIDEAIELAVREHNVEFRSNLWISDIYSSSSFPNGKGYYKRARGRIDVIKYRYSDLFIRLREGQPPKHYYSPKDNGHVAMEEYIEEIRNKKIDHGY